MRLDLDTIADTHGLDASLFLRYHRFMFALFCALSLPSLLLLPVYFSGSNKDLPTKNKTRTIGINRFSISNIPRDGNWRFWLILFVEYVIVIFVCYHLFINLTLYCRDRRRYRAANHPANYAILVQDIPHDARTEDAVKEYWERVFPGLIASVFYVADARQLESWKTRFWEAVDKRETAEWKLHQYEEKQARRTERRSQRTDQRRLFGGLRRRRGKKDTPKETDNDVHSTTLPDSHHSRTDNVPSSSSADFIPPTPSADPSHPANHGMPRPDLIPPTASADPTGTARAAAAAASQGDLGAHAMSQPQEDEAMAYPSAEASNAAIHGPDVTSASIEEPEFPEKLKGTSTAAHSSRVIDHEEDDRDAKNHFRGKLCGIKFRRRSAPRSPERAVEHWELAQRKAWARVVAHQRMRDEGQFPVTQSAIVVFKSRWAASIAAQTNFARKENEWRASRAPEPNAVDWSALCVNGWTVYVRQFISVGLSSALTLFWIIPVTAIMSVVNLKSMANLTIGDSKPFLFLEGVADLSPLITGFVESWMPTVVLSIFLSFVPSIFEFFVSISRLTSLAEQARIVRDWYFVFVVFSNFLFIAFAGSLLTELSRILEKPTETVAILARNIPKQAAFMMNFILLAALTEAPLELLQITRVVTRWFRLKFISKTKRQRDESNTGDMEMDYVGFYSMSQLVGLLGLVYCTIQPFIIFCCIAYFGVTYVVFKYNLGFSFYNEYDDGGRMYGGALYAVWVGVFSHLLTMVGVFGLNKSSAQSALIIIPTVGAVLFLLHCRKSFDRVVEHGSALETQDRIEQLEGLVEDEIDQELAETYEHPGFENLPDYNDIENLNGLESESEEDVLDIEKRAADKTWELEQAGENKLSSTSPTMLGSSDVNEKNETTEIDEQMDRRVRGNFCREDSNGSNTDGEACFVSVDGGSDDRIEPS